MSGSAKRFRVAFSFAGEKREYVAQTAAILAARFGEAAILYDKYHEAEFGRRDLGFYLPDLYHKKTDLVVVVVCPGYEKKPWCGLEWDATFDLLKNGKNSEVMLCRFDHATVRGLYSTAGFVELDDKTPEVAATRILERLALNEGKAKEHYVSKSSSDFRAAPSRLSIGSDLLIGREEELNRLDAAWSGDEKKNVVTIVAWGGVGKTSLVAQWAASTLAKGNHGCIERYFDWSFYSQGTRTEGDAAGADKAASADVFVKEALEFFGDPELAASNAGAWQKGERLAQLVAEHRTLLILDGLEPLQDAKSGELHDQALCALLRGQAADSRGLCVVTTRQQLPELNNWHATTAPEWQLAKLSREAGAELLKNLGVNGTDAEREQLAADVKGHALTLTLLGKYLTEAHGGDIRKHDLMSLTEADYEETSGHAFRVMEAYERWLKKDGRLVELAILRLLGLFDRPATPDCLAALRKAPVIPSFTEALVPLTDAQWNLAVKRLVQLGLVEEQPWEPRRVVGYSEELAKKAMAAARRKRSFPLSEPELFSSVEYTSSDAIDGHPLIREYFGHRLRERAPKAWRVAHARLFEHLQTSVPYWPKGLHGLQPLYQAIVHGCQAGHHERCIEIYANRILRDTVGPNGFYSSTRLGAFGANLAALSCFFVAPWTRPAQELSEDNRAWLLNEAATHLRAFGRLTEAREPMRASIEITARQNDWRNAAIYSLNLSGLELTLGDVASSVREAEQSVALADRSGDAFLRMGSRTIHADALHQAADEDAWTRFEEAEAMQRERQPTYPLLYGLPGFWFSDLLLADAERAAWFELLEFGGWGTILASKDARPIGLEGGSKPPHTESLRAAEQRAAEALDVVLAGSRRLLDTAVNHLLLGRIGLYRAILERSPIDFQGSELPSHIDDAVIRLRQSGEQIWIVHGLLTRTWLRVVRGQLAEARADLAEAQQIAERGPMRLHLVDIRLHRARLFFRDDLDAAREDLRQARALIEKCGYLRRMPELLDAEKVILAVK